MGYEKDYSPMPDMGPIRETEEPQVIILEDPKTHVAGWVIDIMLIIAGGGSIIYFIYRLRKFLALKKANRSDSPLDEKPRKKDKKLSDHAEKRNRKKNRQLEEKKKGKAESRSGTGRSGKKYRAGKRCPSCKTIIDKRRSICQHCGHIFEDVEPSDFDASRSEAVD